ncbi:CatB-related O-acetyltransferase [Listeria fleischmannii]|uniref:CatB-related O-acetyltransferase n=1 Tax=Listeria fleischmannii TaxID=1069827 RepID=A0A841YGD4_9LIST|nr:CatB-related O-acetyltransferase [Listeria fleischmannii]EIA19813.1 capsular polysaccharide synthesis enzyme O-acetyl transferase [Listeria fleischmannii subsp. coloradonensis]MBC1399168.1 CatB-related O-acetyltransferase [Listeria fleischmannii]MBC1427468.1 CatB-related O-acetyltransferase [Listeria fleischmannii]STY36200.1 Chloramphenicol acetyltransferase [Listeria fleischmannii subsp. coloradonensis]
MSLKRWIPPQLSKYIALQKVRRKFPNHRIMSGSVSTEIELGQSCWINYDVHIGKSVKLGDYSYVNKGAIIASGEIGKYCSIGAYSFIGLDEHPLNHFSTSPSTYQNQSWDSFTAPPAIGHDVWIGSTAVILQGVSVGTGAVIGAGAIVTKDVPPYAIVGGNPAKIIRYRFSEKKRRALLESEWWNQPQEELARFIQKLEGEEA